MTSPGFPTWNIASLSDTGRVRSQNEDRCGAFANASGARLFVVADGMGGHRGGATASRIAVDALAAALTRAGTDSSVSGISGISGDWLADAIRAANRNVHAAAAKDAELNGMGTTLVAILVAASGAAWVAHVGDSRAYRLREGVLEPLTEDHSVVAEMVRRGLITPEEAEIHPRRNEILRSVGIEPDVEPELSELELRPGDRVLLCSDGLCGVVPAAELEQLLAAQSPAEAVESAVELANSLGGPDNITAVIAEIPDQPDAPATAKSRGTGASTLALALLVALVAALGAFAFQLWD